MIRWHWYLYHRGWFPYVLCYKNCSLHRHLRNYANKIDYSLRLKKKRFGCSLIQGRSALAGGHRGNFFSLLYHFYSLFCFSLWFCPSSTLIISLYVSITFYFSFSSSEKLFSLYWRKPSSLSDFVISLLSTYVWKQQLGTT